MIIKDLGGLWELRMIGEDSFGIGSQSIKAQVPGTVYHTLLTEKKIPDPYWRDNELQVLPLMDNDFEYRTVFEVSEEDKYCDSLILRFEGIDTLADIYLNDMQIGSVNNMHRAWEFNILWEAQVGSNELRVLLHSPTRYIKEENAKVYTGGSHEAMEGFPHLRKAHCMFGWYWGPRIPDAGIFRPVKLLCVEKARFDDVRISQKHNREKNQVVLDVITREEVFDHDMDCIVKVTVTEPEKERSSKEKARVYRQREDGTILIKSPKLWWPRGYGSQPLYSVCAELYSHDGILLDVWEKKIGLRTMTVNTDADEWGNRFAHEVNGVCIFAMGADYIPEDNLFPRITKERTGELLKAAAIANHNCIRVWGGGYYPDDYFYDCCDELGLLVWQDFMFACASYELDEEFDQNIRAEISENVRRIRHHASLALWCGNNEMETQTLDRCWKPSKKQTADYIKLYEYIIPSIVKKEDPDAFYWPSSPSSGGSFDNPWDENRGDMHYWDVWHGGKPFTEFRKFYFRYLSEFGFQSFPAMRTIESVTLPEDRNVFSRVMEMHQRNVAANGKILNYLSATYLYPKDFEQFVYASQLLQADAIRYGVEHFRRNRGRCMGAVVWQLNDIWPVASWASIDYYGRWKALHYAERRMFAPIMISCEEHGEIDERPYCITERIHPLATSIRLNVSNETMQEVTGTVSFELRDSDGKPLSGANTAGEETVTVPALSSHWCDRVEFTGLEERKTYAAYTFTVGEEIVSEGIALFTAPKHFLFKAPELSLTAEDDVIHVKAVHFAKSVAIESSGDDLILSDNYFDMNPGEKTIRVLQGKADLQKLWVRSVFDIA